jgi:hypothetical protein
MIVRSLAVALIVAALFAPAAFATDAPKLTPDDTASIEAFDQAAKVFASPRCLNCHTTVAWPTQGDDRHRHTFNVVRGPSDKGPPGMLCTNCHKDSNQEAMTIPGAKDWHMAPLSMGWTDLAPGDLCRALLDPKKNGGRTGEQVIAHMRDDRLVLWAWSPGGTRQAPALTHKAFVAALETWLKKGARCPA